jgi:transposase
MNNLFWLNEDQMMRLRPYFPKSRGKSRVDESRLLGGIILNNHNGLRCCNVPADYGPATTLDSR